MDVAVFVNAVKALGKRLHFDDARHLGEEIEGSHQVSLIEMMRAASLVRQASLARLYKEIGRKISSTIHLKIMFDSEYDDQSTTDYWASMRMSVYNPRGSIQTVFSVQMTSSMQLYRDDLSYEGAHAAAVLMILGRSHLSEEAIKKIEEDKIDLKQLLTQAEFDSTKQEWNDLLSMFLLLGAHVDPFEVGQHYLSPAA